MLTVNDLSKKFPAASVYISQIYLVIRDYHYCNNRRLADLVGVSPSAVSQAVGRLKRLDLAVQDRYGMVTLSEEGNRLAENILRRHYLLEHLMVKVLNFPWDLADQEAEHLQDKVSAAFTENLDNRLGHPCVCPHGNPFPCCPQMEEILKAPPLVSAPEGDRVEIIRITEEGERYPNLLHTCFQLGIMPGAEYAVISVDEEKMVLESRDEDGSIQNGRNGNNGSSSDSGKRFSLPAEMAEHIRIRSIDGAVSSENKFETRMQAHG
jgi:DtxR family Mn-dependent transcriptional regulator